MKIIVIGSTKGNLDLINKHIENSSADAVLCTGDIGISYRTDNDNNFSEYLEGRKKFLKPVYTVRGSHDNLSLCKTIIDGAINIDNFHLIEDGETVSIDNDAIEELPIKKIIIGGVGGTYSPKYYKYDKLIGNARRHFCKTHIDSIKAKSLHILLMHDLIENIAKKKIIFSDATFDLIDNTSPLYCFLGKYHWWGATKVDSTNFVILPYAKDGYVLLDTKDWDAEGIRFDIKRD